MNIYHIIYRHGPDGLIRRVKLTAATAKAARAKLVLRHRDAHSVRVVRQSGEPS